MRAIRWRNLCSRGLRHGDQVWLKVVETEGGKFFLEDAFTDWRDHPDVNQHGVYPPQVRTFKSEFLALLHAAEIICERYDTDIDEWVGSLRGDI